MPCGITGGELVSIHAPVRGATGRLERSMDHNLVSIHAPVRGATCQHLSSTPSHICGPVFANQPTYTLLWLHLDDTILNC